MKSFTHPLKFEPVLSATLALVGAVIACLVAFGVDLTVEQIASVTGLAFAIGAVIRSFYTPAAANDYDPDLPVDGPFVDDAELAA